MIGLSSCRGNRASHPIWAGFAYDYLGKGVPFLTGALLALFTLTLFTGIESHLTSHEPALPAVPSADAPTAA